MLHGCNSKKLLAVLLSAVLSWPAPAWSADDRPASAAKDGGGVLLEKVEIGGQVFYLAAGITTPEQEGEAVRAVTQNGENGTLLVSGPNDPVLKLAAGSRVNVVVAEGTEALQLPQRIETSPTLKKRLADKIDKITAFFKNKEKQEGLTFALINASAMTALSLYSSGSVEKGLAVMAVSFAWAAFLMTAPDTWGSILHKSGEGAKWLAEKVFGAFGRKLTRTEARQYDLIGKFVTSWIPNALVAGTVFYGANALNLSSWWTALAQAAFFGLILNYNIWDAVVNQKVNEGVLSHVFRRNYVLAQVFLGTLLEASSYVGFSQAQNILAATTMAGVAYLAGQERIEETLIPRARMLKRSGLFARSRQRCELALVSVKEALVRQPAARKAERFPPDDIQ